MFVPITMLCRVRDRAEAVQLANDSRFGLTAGCYGMMKMRPTSSTTLRPELLTLIVRREPRPAPGRVPAFGGWKVSAFLGQGIASFYYLAQYQREQSQTKVE